MGIEPISDVPKTPMLTITPYLDYLCRTGFEPVLMVPKTIVIPFN